MEVVERAVDGTGEMKKHGRGVVHGLGTRHGEMKWARCRW